MQVSALVLHVRRADELRRTQFHVQTKPRTGAAGLNLGNVQSDEQGARTRLTSIGLHSADLDSGDS